MSIYNDILGHPHPVAILCAGCGVVVYLAPGEEISLCPACEQQIKEQTTVLWSRRHTL